MSTEVQTNLEKPDGVIPTPLTSISAAVCCSASIFARSSAACRFPVPRGTVHVRHLLGGEISTLLKTPPAE